MKILITGSVGFVGSTLTKKLVENGNEVTILTRTIKKGLIFLDGVTFLQKDPVKRGS